MARLPSRLVARIGTALFALFAAGCHRHRTDEEILRDRIDVTTVHLYVASKIAVTRADSAPEVRAARTQIARAVEAYGRLRGTPAPHPSTTQAAMATGAASAPTVSDVPLDPRDLVRLAAALWSLRSEGKRIVENEGEDRLPPVLPILLGADRMPPGIAALFDNNLEHSLMLTVLLMAKLHPRVPTPIPDEILLYEASRTRPDALRVPFFAPIVHTARAYVFGTNELCDLAARDAAAVSSSTPSNAAQWNASMQQATGHATSLTDQQTLATEGSFRAIAHGSAAACYVGRKQPAESRHELRLFLNDAQSLGIDTAQLAPLRAYLSFEDGDRAAAHALLVEARARPDADAATRADIDRMLAAVDAGDRNAVEHQFNRARVAAITLRFGIDALDRAGAFDGLRSNPFVASVVGFGATASQALAATQNTAAARLAGAEHSTRGCAAHFHR